MTSDQLNIIVLTFHDLGRLHAWMLETGDPLLERVPPAPMHLMALAALQDAGKTARP